jgi:hypothetical protein
VGTLSLSLQLRQNDSLLLLILSAPVRVADLARLIGLEEENLAQALVRVDSRRQRRSVRYLQGYETLPLRLEGRDIDDNAAAGVSGFAHAYRQHVTWNLEILDRPRQGKRVRRHDHGLGFNGDKGALVEVLGINNRTVYVGKDLKFVGYAQVIAVGRKAIRNDPLA